jgi:hypothetical protein
VSLRRAAFAIWYTSELVCHLEEVDISDWKHRKMRKVLAAATMRSSTIHHGISRNVKHISVISRVDITGKSVIPYIIESQDLGSVGKQFKKHGVRFGTDLICKLNAKPSVNMDISFDYI